MFALEYASCHKNVQVYTICLEINDPDWFKQQKVPADEIMGWQSTSCPFLILFCFQCDCQKQDENIAPPMPYFNATCKNKHDGTLQNVSVLTLRVLSVPHLLCLFYCHSDLLITKTGLIHDPNTKTGPLYKLFPISSWFD